MQILERQHTLLTHEADAFGQWRPDAIFRLMQEIAGAHSRALGLSREEMLEKSGTVWMLARAQLDVYRYPKLYDVVHAKTWYGTPEKTTYPRYVVIEDENGTPLAALATSWIVVDIAARRILLPAKAGLVFPPAAQITPPIEEPGRLRMRKEGTVTSSRRIPLYSDIDVNGHMNNASYVGWILDLFPIEYHATHRIRTLSVSYAAEARPGAYVEMTLYRDKELFEVQGLDADDGHVVFEAQGEWQRIS